jgi:hypothetical protein
VSKLDSNWGDAGGGNGDGETAGKPGQEGVKKMISLSFRDFIFDPKCLPTPQRSLIRHPRAIFFTPSSLQILKSIFSHLPDGVTPVAEASGYSAFTFNAIRVPLSLVSHPIEENPTGDLYHQSLVA